MIVKNRNNYILVLLIFLLLCSSYCSKRKDPSSIKTKNLILDHQEILDGLKFELVFTKSFELYPLTRVNPFEKGIMVFHSKGGEGILNLYDFKGNTIKEDIKLKFDLQDPESLSSLNCFYDSFSKKLYNTSFPFLKVFDVDLLKTTTVWKIDPSSGLNSYKAPFYYGFHNGPNDAFVLPFFDMLKNTKKYEVFGIGKFKRDFTGFKSLKTFNFTPKESFKKSGTKRYFSSNYFRQRTDFFPLAVDKNHKKIYYISNIWKPSFGSLDFSGKEITYTLNFKKHLLSKENHEDLDIWFKYHSEILKRMRNLTIEKKKFESLPCFFNIMVFEEYLIVVTPIYNDQNNKLAYVFDNSDLKYLGITYIPSSHGTVEHSYLFDEYYISITLIEKEGSMFNQINLYTVKRKKP